MLGFKSFDEPMYKMRLSLEYQSTLAWQPDDNSHKKSNETKHKSADKQELVLWHL